MSVIVAMLRGVNVTGNHMVKMETLRALCSALGCTDVQTYLQSGNVVFRIAGRAPSAEAMAALAVRLGTRFCDLKKSRPFASLWLGGRVVAMMDGGDDEPRSQQRDLGHPAFGGSGLL